MKENIYDDPGFFAAYGKMARSEKGLPAAVEWHELRKMLPEFVDKRVLDLGCGYGWHCRHAVKNGARAVVGIDLSEKMIDKARQLTTDACVTYQLSAIEDFVAEAGSFDVVLSSLALHYVGSLDSVCRKVYHLLAPGGVFVFSVEHPVFTSADAREWIYDANGRKLHWPVDKYFEETKRRTNFLGACVTKYHRTIATYLNTLLEAGFSLSKIVEPVPDIKMLNENSELKNELRRPMMLLISARKAKAE